MPGKLSNLFLPAFHLIIGESAMNKQTPRTFLIVTILAVTLAVCGNGRSSVRVDAPTSVATPTPTPEIKTMSENRSKTAAGTGPVSGQAASSGVSVPVREIPPATLKAKQPPHEINPQNTIPIKKVKRPIQAGSLPEKSASKQKPSGRPTTKKKSRQVWLKQ